MTLEQEILQAWGYGTYSEITNRNATIAAKIARERIKEDSKAFFVWLVRVAQVDVINAETALELKGKADGLGFVPVVTLEEVYQLYLKENGLL